MIAPNNLATHFKYDESNRLIERIDSLGNKTTFTYDPMGNLIGKQDPRGSNWTYQYYDNNALKRLDVKGPTTQIIGWSTSMTKLGIANRLMIQEIIPSNTTITMVHIRATR